MLHAFASECSLEVLLSALLAAHVSKDTTCPYNQQLRHVEFRTYRLLCDTGLIVFTLYGAYTSSTINLSTTYGANTHQLVCTCEYVQAVTAHSDKHNDGPAGESNRSTASHALNSTSSRSHTVFTIHVQVRMLGEGEERALTSKLNLVDLAGSERTKKTGVTGQALKVAPCLFPLLIFAGAVITCASCSKWRHGTLTILEWTKQLVVGCNVISNKPVTCFMLVA